jgi:small subunit ribosomal protein S2
MFASGEIEKYTKKEQVVMKKQLEKLDKYLIGLTALEKLPDAVYIADMRTEKTALAETDTNRSAYTVAVCDTNTNPTKVHLSNSSQ